MRLLTAVYALALQAALPQPGVAAGGSKAVTIAVHANPALWLIGALIVGSLLEAFVLLILYRASEPIRRHVSGAFVWAVHPFTGPDGRPSFSKIVDLLVLGGYWSGAPIPEGVAMLVIGSAHGTKVLLAIVDKLSLNVNSAAQLARTITRTETKTDTVSTAPPPAVPAAPAAAAPAQPTAATPAPEPEPDTPPARGRAG